MAKNVQVIKIKSNEENPEPVEIIAQAIIDVAEGFKKIDNSRLSRRAVKLLLHDITGVKLNDIDYILNAGADLERYFIKDLPKKTNNAAGTKKRG